MCEDFDPGSGLVKVGGGPFSVTSASTTQAKVMLMASKTGTARRLTTNFTH